MRLKSGIFGELEVNKIIRYCLILILLSFSCARQPEVKKYHHSKILMNTIFEITVYSALKRSKIEKIIDDSFRIAYQLEEEFSISKSNSIVNRLSIEKKLSIDEEIFNILKKAYYFYRISDKKFDVTIGNLVKCWGFYNENYRLPSADEIKEARNMVGFDKIEFSSNFIRLKEEVSLDFGGILKGYAVEKMVNFLISKGIEAGIVNAGGNLKVFGKKPDKSPWKIGIRHPRKNNEIYKVIELQPGEAVATSGDYERFFITNNMRFHHIIDPQTGYPARNDLVSVTVITTDAMDADAYSTTLFLLGSKKAGKLALAENLKVILLSTDSNGEVVEISPESPKH